MANEVEKFFEDLPAEDKTPVDIFEVPATEKVEGKVDSLSEEELESIKNRQITRLKGKIQSEREANIALSTRLKVLSETETHQKSTTTDDLDKALLSMYGEDANGRKAAEIHKNILEQVKSEAKEQAVQEIEARQEKVQSQQREFESFIDSELEGLEDEHNVDLTSDAPKARKERREFLEMVQGLSPKDEDGTITGYADFGATWEMYQLKKSQEKSPDSINKQKELGSRSMTKSGSSDNSKQEKDEVRAYLLKSGIRGI